MSEPTLNHAPFGLDSEWEEPKYWASTQSLSRAALVFSFDSSQFENECVVHASSESLAVAIYCWKTINRSNANFKSVSYSKSEVDDQAKGAGIRQVVVLQYNFAINKFDLHDYWTVPQ